VARAAKRQLQVDLQERLAYPFQEQKAKGSIMPTPGLSLVGFMQDRDQALDHLRNTCVPPVDTDVALEAEWNKAKSMLGAPFKNPGNPTIAPLPASHHPYEAQLRTGPYSGNFALPHMLGATVQLVEIDPLLAFQFTIDDDRSNHHCSGLSNPPTLDEMLAVCLPLNPQVEHFRVHQQPGSMLIKARSLNLQMQAQGFIVPGSVAGIAIGVSLPFTHVVRYNNRYYLHNGFHRTLGLRKAGATHIPCVFRDVPDHLAAGVRGAGATFDITLLESQNPPTLAHFTRGHALPVALRATSRVINIHWSENVVFDE
jgi:hypothetical protein